MAIPNEVKNIPPVKVNRAALSELKPDNKNANRGTERGRKMVAESLKRYGAGRSILLDKNGNIIAGNKTAEQAAAAGMSNVLVVESDGSQLVAVKRTDLSLDDNAARELAIADNRTAEVGLDWDPSVLDEMHDAGADLDALFNESEWNALMALVGHTGEPKDAEPQFDKAEELQAKWGTASGQLWQVGAHRLLCGDSTKADDVARVMGGARMDATLTDPPYGVGWQYESTDDTQDNLNRLIAGFLPLARSASDVVLLTSGNKNQSLYPVPSWILAWFVPAGAGRGPWGFTCWQPVLAYGKDPYLARGKGGRPDAFVLTESAPDVAHPCPKPDGVWAWLLERCTAERGAKVYDPFLGSGTTMVAAQNLGRVCYGIEIEPKYCAVVLERMATAFPDLKINGQTD